ncbi:MAG: hypothetical protein ABJC89_13170, partial [Acidobacteriota bacterium]
WTNLSVGTYNSNIRNGRTGARRLDLPLVDPTQGAVPIDLIRRPAVTVPAENIARALVYQQRFFSQAALRIVLSDNAAQLTSLPTVTGTAPVPLDGTATAAQILVDATHPPLAVSAGPHTAQTNGTTSSGSNRNIDLDPNNVLGLLPTLRLGGTPVFCGEKTANQFRNCNLLMPASATGTAVTGAGGFATVTTAPVTGVSTTISVTNNSTAGFVPLPFFSGDDISTCTGYNGGNQLTGCTVSANIPNNTVLTSAALSTAGEALIDGFIKIEQQTASGVWRDVTTEILNLGFSGRNLRGTICGDPTPNAIIRFQRLRDNGGICDYAASTKPTDYWPNALYDTREGLQRDNVATSSKAIALGGIMDYISLDANNYRRWVAGGIGATGNQSWNNNNNGYIVYFSDRRNNNSNTPGAPVETGEYGYEDLVNPADANGVPNGILDVGEDVNGVNGLEVYGRIPRNLPAGAALPFTAAALPYNTVVGGVAIRAPHAMVNRQILFRRALKLVNGANGNLPQGFTVAAENPIYVHGDYNADPTNTLIEPHAPAAVIADAVTLLSNSWNDVNSFVNPNDPGQRSAVTTGYRMAIISGKTLSFPRPTAGSPGQDFGTDGGAHNFLRYIEAWGGASLNYRGSIVSFYISRQASGTFKCCTNVYGPPTRGYNFDTEFLTPSLLPPGTPMFRDINTLTFRQLLRPNQ